MPKAAIFTASPVLRKVNCRSSRLRPSAPRRVDYFGNLLCFFTIQEPHKELVVESRSEVIMEGNATPLPQPSLPWEEAANACPTITVLRDSKPISLDLSRRASGYGQSLPPTHSSRSRHGGRWRRCAFRSDGAHSQRLSLRFKSDQRPNADRRSLSKAPRRVPGFRTLANRLPSLSESRGPLRKRIPADLSTSRAAQAGGRRCIPRLGVSLLSGNRMA